ncbi:MAG TPA: hypothetical protein QGH09_02910, partial [Vicinamibacterales bacterium]|nr:hypothetical protein [Vicinamibacterales bacterium]
GSMLSVTRLEAEAMSARVELHENLRRPVRKMDPGLALGDHGARREAAGVNTELVMSGSLVAWTGIQDGLDNNGQPILDSFRRLLNKACRV